MDLFGLSTSAYIIYLHELATSDDAKDAVCLSMFMKETIDMLLKKKFVGSESIFFAPYAVSAPLVAIGLPVPFIFQSQTDVA